MRLDQPSAFYDFARSFEITNEVSLFGDLFAEFYIRFESSFFEGAKIPFVSGILTKLGVDQGSSHFF